MPGKDPQRSCIACGTTRNKGELLRFVLSPERELVFDLLAKLPGRGAYTCLDGGCIRVALKKGIFKRAFKGDLDQPDGDLLCGRIVFKMEERIASYLALANKAGKVVSGSDMSMDMLRKGKAGFVFIARDISADIGAKVRELAGRCGVPHAAIFAKERLGALTGKGLRSAVAIEQGGFVETIKSEVAKYGNFLEGGVDAR
jgi:predicted RNA-binding protein YlxR (DUF448 family)/ribosomal protein L7Ae-like RNA K-turn-binding protein